MTYVHVSATPTEAQTRTNVINDQWSHCCAHAWCAAPHCRRLVPAPAPTCMRAASTCMRVVRGRRELQMGEEKLPKPMKLGEAVSKVRARGGVGWARAAGCLSFPSSGLYLLWGGGALGAAPGLVHAATWLLLRGHDMHSHTSCNTAAAQHAAAPHNPLARPPRAAAAVRGRLRARAHSRPRHPRLHCRASLATRPLPTSSAARGCSSSAWASTRRACASGSTCSTR